MTDTKNCLEVKLAEFRELNAYHLADMAGCGTPDTLTSPGAVLLDDVRASVLDSWEDAATREDRTNEDTRADVEWQDVAHTIADNAPSVYTHECWTQFVDLCAYQEDISELVDANSSDMNANAMVALYVIAERLALLMFEALVEELGCDCCTDDEADDEA